MQNDTKEKTIKSKINFISNIVFSVVLVIAFAVGIFVRIYRYKNSENVNGFSNKVGSTSNIVDSNGVEYSVNGDIKILVKCPANCSDKVLEVGEDVDEIAANAFSGVKDDIIVLLTSENTKVKKDAFANSTAVVANLAGAEIEVGENIANLCIIDDNDEYFYIGFSDDGFGGFDEFNGFNAFGEFGGFGDGLGEENADTEIKVRDNASEGYYLYITKDGINKTNKAYVIKVSRSNGLPVIERTTEITEYISGLEK